MVFHLDMKEFHAHKYILCTASDIMRHLFGVTEEIKLETIAVCKNWKPEQVAQVSPNAINNGYIDGLLSFQE